MDIIATYRMYGDVYNPQPYKILQAYIKNDALVITDNQKF